MRLDDVAGARGLCEKGSTTGFDASTRSVVGIEEGVNGEAVGGGT